MSFHYDEAIPPVRKQLKSVSLRGRISTAYDSEVPSFAVQEPTPEMSQSEFADTLSPKSLPSHQNNSDPGSPPTREGKSTAPAPFSPPASVFPPKTPPHSRRTSEETTPKPSPSRRDSVPIRKPSRAIVNDKPLTVYCESCRSSHSVSVSEADRTMVLSCNVVPPPPTPSPSVLELYHLPGYLTLNDKGQIIVSTETELLSYVRKIFIPSDKFVGMFPTTRSFCISTYDEDSTLSQSSTPDAKRASYYLGHSKYLGTYSLSATEPSTPIDRVQSEKIATEDDKTPEASGSIVRGPLEPYIPPAVPHGTKPTGSSPRQSGTASIIAFVREVSPSPTLPPAPSSPKHATAARRASPRNLSPIGIFSESEVDLPIPVKTESIQIRVGSSRTSRSHSQPGYPPDVKPPSRHELYNQATEISRELSSAQMPARQSDRDYFVQQREPSPRGRNSSRY
uniref:Uncharacterized protein n=1 Tax=Exserohilum turcicum partitivirus 1 TaxID=3229043 RepID=A0AAU7YCJ9_9VIRU